MSDEREWKLEEAYLDKVYNKLTETYQDVVQAAEHADQDSRQFIQGLSGDLRMSQDSISDSFESLIEVEQKNQELAQLNYKREWLAKQHHNVTQLMNSAYFAKLDVQYPDEEDVESFYIGVAGFSDDHHEQYVYDWRSPIANLYYENNIGKTSYEAPVGTVPVDLKNRRQIRVERDRLLDFFDTTTAIEDPMLLEVLNESSSAKLQDITSTIQREQNEIIRDTSSHVLIVEGIAGSGKTSTILQRIAYLLYRYRDDLLPEQVLLLSPNPMFSQYIEEVLPSLGEKNPRQMTFRDLMKLKGRHYPVETMAEQLENQTVRTDLTHMLTLESYVEKLTAKDIYFIPLKREEEVVISAEWMQETLASLPDSTEMYRRLEYVREQMLAQVERYIKTESKQAYWRDEVQDLSNEEYKQLFPKGMKGSEDDNIERIAFKLLTKRFGNVRQRIQRYGWLDLERHYVEATGEALSLPLSLDQSTEFAYLHYLLLRQRNERRVKYVIVDEVQDYSETQLYFLSKIFDQANFTLVGDGLQSIFVQGTSFDRMAPIFEGEGRRIKRMALKKSYRSSGPISQLMKHLAGGESSGIEVINRPGKNPVYVPLKNEQAYREYLQTFIAQREKNTRRVILTKTSEEAKTLYESLGRPHDLHVVTDTAAMNFSTKTMMMPIHLAKGLEFDHVLIHDVSNNHYPDTQMARHLLYTASSRAMHELTLPFIAQLTELLK